MFDCVELAVTHDGHALYTLTQRVEVIKLDWTESYQRFLSLPAEVHHLVVLPPPGRHLEVVRAGGVALGRRRRRKGRKAGEKVSAVLVERQRVGEVQVGVVWLCEVGVT